MYVRMYAIYVRTYVCTYVCNLCTYVCLYVTYVYVCIQLQEKTHLKKVNKSISSSILI